MTAKTKRDRAAGRKHRHTALQTIIDNHQGIIDDIAGIDNRYARLDQSNKDTRQNVAYTMRRVVENERKVAEIEPALALLQESSKRQVTINEMTHGVQKEHQEAIAQLIVCTNKVHGKQTNLNRELNLTRAAVDEVSNDLMWFGWLLIGLSATTILAYIILFLIVIAK